MNNYIDYDAYNSVDDMRILTDFDILYSVYNECATGYSHLAHVQKAQFDIFKNIEYLRNKTLQGKALSYRPTITYKTRRFKYLERVAHKVFYDFIIVPRLQNHIIKNNCAFFPKRGTEYAHNCIISTLKKIFRKHKNDFFAVELKLNGFKDINISMIYLQLYTLFNNKIAWEIFRQYLEKIPENRKLGLSSPIYNLPQLLICNKMDHSISSHPKCLGYVRYYNRIIFFAKNQSDIYHILDTIGNQAFNCNLSIHEPSVRITNCNYDYFHFLECRYRITKNKRITREMNPEIINRMIRKMQRIHHIILNPGWRLTTYQITIFDLIRMYYNWFFQIIKYDKSDQNISKITSFFVRFFSFNPRNSTLLLQISVLRGGLYRLIHHNVRNGNRRIRYYCEKQLCKLENLQRGIL